MTTVRLAMVAALLAVFAVACSRSEEPAKGSNALLAYVPGDTPYLAANLEPLPETVADAYLARMQPVLDELQAQLTQARADLEASQGAAADDDPAARLALAVMRQLDGNLSRAGLSRLGLDVLSHKVAYGIGAFPVLRMGLSNPETLRATILTVLEDAGISAPEQTYEGVKFWRMILDDQDESPVSLYLVIREDHLAVGLLPPAFEPEWLPAFLGLSMPTDSRAAEQLAELVRANGHTPYGSGILDLHRLADQFLQTDSVTARVMAATGEYDPASVTPECVTEIHGIIDHAPRLTAGTTELSASTIAYQYRLESPRTLANQLADLVAELPAADPQSKRVLELSFGLRLGAVRDFLREKLSAIVADPYVCEYLQDLNSSAEESLARLDQPMPPFINNFRGLRLSLDELTAVGEYLPTNARGLLALHVEQPEMFVGMAQMFLPDLSTLALTPGGEPVELPDSLIPIPDLVAFAAMSDDAIGLSVGSGEEALLRGFLAQKPGPDDMFLSASYDMAAYLDYSERIAGSIQGDDPEIADDMSAVHSIENTAREAYRDMADRSYTSLRFSPGGLEIDGRVTFKP